MPTELANPEDKPSRLACWAALCPKLGLGIYTGGLLAQCALKLTNANAFSIGGMAALILGPLAGLGLGIIVLLRKPSSPSRKKAWSGIGWGTTILVVVSLLCVCVVMLGKAYRDANTLKSIHRVYQAEVQFHESRPEQSVSMNALLNSHTIAPETLFYWDDNATRPFQAADEALEKTPYVLTPHFHPSPDSKNIAVFIDPELAPFKKRGEVPIVYANGTFTFLPIPDLEKSLKQQTGLTAAEIVRQQRGR